MNTSVRANTMNPMTPAPSSRFDRSHVPYRAPKVRVEDRGAARLGGFSLIELLVVVAIISILAMIAYPSYQQYFVSARRSAAQSVMLHLVNREHQYFAANRRYATAADLGFSVPADLEPYYAETITVDAGLPPSFTIAFTPVDGSPQASDAPLTLDGVGNKTPAEKWLR